MSSCIRFIRDECISREEFVVHDRQFRCMCIQDPIDELDNVARSLCKANVENIARKCKLIFEVISSAILLVQSSSTSVTEISWVDLVHTLQLQASKK